MKQKLPVNFIMALHAHLPYVRHPEHEVFLEENWLFEAITETYIPLLDVFERLCSDGIPCPVTLSLSPPLIEMLNDDLLRNRYARYLKQRLELAENEVRRTNRKPEFHETALMYRDRFLKFKHLYEDRYAGDLVGAFAALQEQSEIEIITTTATHGFLPHLSEHEESVQAQLGIAAEHYLHTFGRPPSGLWLPECGYYTGLDRLIREAGFNYFFLEAHGVIFAKPTPNYGHYNAITTPSGTAVLGRDPFSANQVWSSHNGYPGDFDYRDFYRDIGFDLPLDTIGPYIHPDGIRINTGLKYYRITGTSEVKNKKIYQRTNAISKAKLHAEHFVDHVLSGRGITNFKFYNRTAQPVITCAYDAELFGHWWFEGPEWLEFVYRKLATDGKNLQPVTAGAYLQQHGGSQVQTTPAPSSWGQGGYGAMWLDQTNDWIHPLIHDAAEKMVELATNYSNADGTLRNALNQAARELLLAQSSDWPFLIRQNTASTYSERRIRCHIKNFHKLAVAVQSGRVSELKLASQTDRNKKNKKSKNNWNNVFRQIDLLRFFLKADRRKDIF